MCSIFHTWFPITLFVIYFSMMLYIFVKGAGGCPNLSEQQFLANSEPCLEWPPDFDGYDPRHSYVYG